MWLTIAILYFFDVGPLIDGKAFGAVLILLELWGLSITGFTYMISFMFAKHSMAQVGVIMFNFLFGLILPIATFVLGLISETTRNIAKIIIPILRVFPSFSLANSMMNIVFLDVLSMMNNKKYTIYSWDIAGGGMVYMGVGSVLFFIVTLLIEYLIRRPGVSKVLGPNTAALHQGQVDEDVAKEAARINKGCDDVVKIKDMTKVYKGGKMAVRGISLGK